MNIKNANVESLKLNFKRLDAKISKEIEVESALGLAKTIEYAMQNTFMLNDMTSIITTTSFDIFACSDNVYSDNDAIFNIELTDNVIKFNIKYLNEEMIAEFEKLINKL